ncbi:DoxX family membrane protein [Pedobacter punctiformis]|uniref:DoxX family membrane protein n=1 Tax=Pedobacter punctiformis TaxID=3004097 RepID=A0ABT4L8Q7_9SPHI|nr:DoxX family membrane protein [Pedobacter sp. HCMS5-2]MCZ4244285.1 DoxX family membrane protein [Pedobacter sp. HCMS5-2]
MKNSFKIAQLLLRFSLGISFLTPVSDRLGFLGPMGNKNIEWGNWNNFIDYTATLMPFLSRPVVNVMGIMATIAEVIIGILLIIGFKTRYAALASCMLTLTFIVCMSLFLGVKAPINFSTFTVCSASLLLSAVPGYKWSIDDLSDDASK